MKPEQEMLPIEIYPTLGFSVLIAIPSILLRKRVNLRPTKLVNEEIIKVLEFGCFQERRIGDIDRVCICEEHIPAVEGIISRRYDFWVSELAPLS